MLSPYENHLAELVDCLKDANCDVEVVSPTTGPRGFVDRILEMENEIEKSIESPELNHRMLSSITAGGVSLAALTQDGSPYAGDPWKEVRTIFIRAFQSMKSRKALKGFVLAISDGRMSGAPVDLSRLRPEWCNQEHQIYAVCWRGLDRSSKPTSLSDTVDRKSDKKDARVGDMTMRALAAKFKTKDKKIVAAINKMIAHKPAATLVGRVMRFIKKDDTNALMMDTMAHVKAIAATGDIDMGRVIRTCVSMAKAGGVDTGKSVSQVASILKGVTDKDN